MHPLPTRFPPRPAISGDSMTRTTFDSAQPFGIEMQHVSRRRMLVSKNRRRRIKHPQTTDSRSPAHSGDGCNTAYHSLSDLADRHSASTQRDDLASLLLTDLVRLPSRS